MKRYLVLLLFILPCKGHAQNPSLIDKPYVDKRVELLSIVFRLADSREYSSTLFKNYTGKIEQHFTPFKNHELIQFIKKLRKKRGVGYDAVMSMAIHISQPPGLAPLVPFSGEAPDSRWGKANAGQFMTLLRKFYFDASCEAFFRENEELYRTAARRFMKVYRKLDAGWYRDFYGEGPQGSFEIVIGLGNGGGNYGPKIIFPDGTETVYAIMGTWSTDGNGLPEYKVNDYFPTLLHEFNHSFVNHLTVAYHSELRKSAAAIFKELKEIMRNQAYGDWETMINESIVRAAVIKYLEDHDSGKTLVDKELNHQINRGFLWTKDLVAELERYDANREKYPALASFMPEIVRFFDRTAGDLEYIKRTVEEKRPKVISIGPFTNGEKAVDPATKLIVIHFDRPLKGKGYSINYGKGGRKSFPDMGEVTYSDDNKTVLIEVKLKPGTAYAFVLTGLSFIAKDGFGMKDYEVRFKTAGEKE